MTILYIFNFSILYHWQFSLFSNSMFPCGNGNNREYLDRKSLLRSKKTAPMTNYWSQQNAISESLPLKQSSFLRKFSNHPGTTCRCAEAEGGSPAAGSQTEINAPTKNFTDWKRTFNYANGNATSRNPVGPYCRPWHSSTASKLAAIRFNKSNAVRWTVAYNVNKIHIWTVVLSCI